MRIYYSLVLGGLGALLFAIAALFSAGSARVSAAGGVCGGSTCSIADTTLSDFAQGALTYTALRNIGDGEVQLLPVALTGPWREDAHPLLFKRAELAAVIYNDVIFAIGGTDPQGNISDDIDAVSTTAAGPLASNWSHVADLPLGLSGMAAAIAPTANGAILYVLGGVQATPYSPVTTVYYHSLTPGGVFTGSWNTAYLPPSGVSTPLYYHQALVHNGYLYVIGGYDYTVSHNEIYHAQINADGSLGAWEQDVSFANTGRRSLAAAIWTSGTGQDYLYVIGGLQDGKQIGEADVDYTSFADSNGSLNAFQSYASALPSGFYGHGAAQANRVLYVTGGDPGDGHVGSTAVESYLIEPDGTFHNWGGYYHIASNNLPQPREFHGTVVNSSGIVYVLGGRGPSGPADNVFYGSTSGFGSNYAPAGNYLSRIIDLPSHTQLTSIIANTTVTDTTSLTMTLQYRVSNTTRADLLNAPWVTLGNAPQGDSVPTNFPISPVAGFLQYQVFFTSTVPYNASPVLNSLQINYPAPNTPTPTATSTRTPTPGSSPTPTPTPTGSFPDLTIIGIQSPPIGSSSQIAEQTLKVYVANLGNVAFDARNALVSQAQTGQQTGIPGAPRGRPLLLARSQDKASATDKYVWVDVYVDRTIPSSVGDLGNCSAGNGATNWGYLYGLRPGESAVVSVGCLVTSNQVHTFYAQIDTCDDPQEVKCSLTIGYVLERNESNNIHGPVSSGDPGPAFMFLPGFGRK